VLRVSTLYADTSVTTAAYYTRYLVQADGEQPGHWTGRQAALLGLSGEVTSEDLQALLEGRDPHTGMSLGSPFVNRVTSSGRVLRAVAGFDATLLARYDPDGGPFVTPARLPTPRGLVPPSRCDARRIHISQFASSAASVRATTS
jgi:hypothetical protein